MDCKWGIRKGADLGEGGDHGCPHFYCLAAKWISQFHSNLRFSLAAKKS